MADNHFSKNTEEFAIYTQMYIRMRRVAGRVIDASYMAENAEYAAHIVALAKGSQDADLLALVGRLESLNPAAVQAVRSKEQGPTEEEVYQRQVHHHYIGYLR